MAAMRNLCSMLFAFLFTGTILTSVSTTVITLENNCNYGVWPATSSSGTAIIDEGGFVMPPGATVQFPAPSGWSGRFWARTGCRFDNSGNGFCFTGDCAGKLQCTAGGTPPVTLAEFTLGNDDGAGRDFYDVSLVDGYNVGIGVRTLGGSGDCRYAGCQDDINKGCPHELQVRDDCGKVVACKSACLAFNRPEYCCTGEHSTPATCGTTMYSRLFKDACPTAYSYAYDDKSSLWTCSGSDYVITFCPTSFD